MIFEKFFGINITSTREMFADGEQILTQAEFCCEANKVTSYLQAQGIGREDVVCICLPRGVAVPVCLVGVWRAGACAMVVEASASDENKTFFFEDAKPRLIIDETVFAQMFPCEETLGNYEPDDHDAAYIVYSSSSTGFPKGIVHEYGEIKHYCDLSGIMNEGFEVSHERHYFIGGLYDASFFNTVVYVINALSFCFIGPFCVSEIDIDELCYQAERLRITDMTLMPELIDVSRIFEIPTLEYLIVSYDVVGSLPVAPIPTYNAYGMSEALMSLTLSIVSGKEPIARAGFSSGAYPLFLVDESGTIIHEIPMRNIKEDNLIASSSDFIPSRASMFPTEDIGEIAFINPYLRGYLNRPKDNEQAFRDGYFLTGDMGYFDETYGLVVLGRKRDFARSPEGWVVPAYVKAALSELLNDRPIVVRAFENDPSKRSSCESSGLSVCVFYEGPEISCEEQSMLASKIPEALPTYMYPSHWINVKAIPRLASGKLNRAALAELFLSTQTEM